MKNSLTIENKSIRPIGTNIFENLENAKEVITSICNELDFQQKRTLRYALQADQCLIRILSQELCQLEKESRFAGSETLFLSKNAPFSKFSRHSPPSHLFPPKTTTFSSSKPKKSPLLKSLL